MIYSPRAQPSVNKSRIHEAYFHMGEVSEQWRKTVVNNSRVFNFSNCSVVFEL